MPSVLSPDAWRFAEIFEAILDIKMISLTGVDEESGLAGYKARLSASIDDRTKGLKSFVEEGRWRGLA